MSFHPNFNFLLRKKLSSKKKILKKFFPIHRRKLLFPKFAAGCLEQFNFFKERTQRIWNYYILTRMFFELIETTCKPSLSLPKYLSSMKSGKVEMMCFTSNTLPANNLGLHPCKLNFIFLHIES